MRSRSCHPERCNSDSAAAVGEAGDVHASLVDIRVRKHLLDESPQEADVVDAVAHRAAATGAGVPGVEEALRVDDDEPFGVGECLKSRNESLLCLVRPGTVQIEHQGDGGRAVIAGRDVHVVEPRLALEDQGQVDVIPRRKVGVGGRGG